MHMPINPLTPKLALNKAYLKVKPQRSEFERFKANLNTLLARINPTESEEFHKNLISDFLKNTYYDPDYLINTKGRNDLVIYNGARLTDSVGVIFETKKPTNSAEMPTLNTLNSKALQELVLYYLRERITHNNLEVKHLVITNSDEWFIFDAVIFERLFAQNHALLKQFHDFEQGRLADTRTDFFYKQIAEPFIDSISTALEFTYFRLNNPQSPLNLNDDNALIALFKIFSPEHLLKRPFANDSNRLDKRFYSELLHIIGLTESKAGSKKLIDRNPPAARHSGTLIEDAIIQLDSLDKLSRLPNPHHFGSTAEDQLFAVALELAITWVNRILFLKLLEAQLIRYHHGDPGYAFLNRHKIKHYDDLNSLFFQVLARQHDQRNADVQTAFAQVPYLNSSLFEPTNLEQITLFISNLNDSKKIPIFSQTVLKDSHGNKRSGDLSTLDYLFEFLNAYDFSSEGAEEIQEDNKTLINAAVLGLIFEKINGYKDGSFFTPGFITMYMCRETIRNAVVQKFNAVKHWNCNSIEDLYNLIEDRNEANQIINSLKICDPAVGSGHFLVSALNELIAVKNDLKILQDRAGKRLKEYRIEVVNDELVITDDDGELFEYHPNSQERQRIQEALFHEKQTLIEQCLFGVDINPNSVKICRLRLWIELLKHAYYKNTTELETLPNIDINIKCGNSLVSRFAIDADLKQALKKSKWTIDSYRLAVDTYRNAQNKEQKREMQRLIDDIKSNFRSEIFANDPKLKQLRTLQAELLHTKSQQKLFEMSKKEQAAWDKQLAQLTKEIAKVESELEEIKANKIFEQAFEWRFEFPEVLNDDGDFVGFDVVIGNPPYMRVQEIQASQPAQKLFYEKKYNNATASYDIANIFFELAVNVSSDSANNAYIFPHKFLNAASSEVFRNYLKQGQYIDEIAHFGANMIFDDADTYTCVTRFSKKPSAGFYFQRFPFKSDFKSRMLNKQRYAYVTYEMIEKAAELYGNNQWILFDETLEFSVFEKIYAKSKLFKHIFEDIFQGIATSKDNLYIVDCIDKDNFIVKVPISGKEYQIERELFKPFLMGKNVQRYSYLSTNKYVFFPYSVENGLAKIVTIDEIEKKYPLTFVYIKDHETVFKARERGKAAKMQHWHGYIYPKNLNKFEQQKLSSMEICTSRPNVTLNQENFYHSTTVYSWIKQQTTEESYEYFLAIANSKLLWWFLKSTGDTLQGDARRFQTNYINPFPVPEKVSKETEIKISNQVKEVLAIKKQNPSADTKELENQIDQLVYQLYGLTDEEIEIVEKASG